MNERGLTRAMLSKDTGLPYTTIDGILKRDAFESLKLSTLQTLKEYFDVSLDYLIDDNIQDKHYGKPENSHEQTVINAYRNNPVMQAAVEKLLGVDSATVGDDTIVSSSSL